MANSKKRCRHCKKYRVIEEGILINGGFYCDHDHAIQYANSAVLKQKTEDKQWRESMPKTKIEFNRNDIPWQHKQTQPAFNRMRVLEELKWFSDRGLNPTCISCGKENMDWCCGHLKTVGAQSNLRYDRKNTKLQCNRYCNMGLSGNIDGNKTTRGYKQGLLERFGKEEGQSIIDYCETNTAPHKWTCDELESMRAAFSKAARELK